MRLTLILTFLLSVSSAFAQEGQVKDSDTYQHKKNSIYIDDYVIFLPAVCYDRIFPLKKTLGLVVKAGVGLNLYGGGSFFVTESYFLFGQNKDFFEAGGGLLVGDFEGLGFGRIGYRYIAKKGFLFKGGLLYSPIAKIAFPTVGFGYSF